MHIDSDYVPVSGVYDNQYVRIGHTMTFQQKPTEKQLEKLAWQIENEIIGDKKVFIISVDEIAFNQYKKGSMAQWLNCSLQGGGINYILLRGRPRDGAMSWDIDIFPTGTKEILHLIEYRIKYSWDLLFIYKLHPVSENPWCEKIFEITEIHEEYLKKLERLMIASQFNILPTNENNSFLTRILDLIFEEAKRAVERSEYTSLKWTEPNLNGDIFPVGSYNYVSNI